MSSEALLQVKDLSVSFTNDGRTVEVVDRVSFELRKGETLALVGESGSGKSVSSSAILGLLPHPQGRVTGGTITYAGESVMSMAPERLRSLRGGQISMVFQEPMTALNPVHKAGDQIREVLALHRPELKGEALESQIIELLTQVEMPAPRDRVGAYPFQLSGGMRQRVMIAMALAGEPEVLIADEPTTALDVTVQAQILKLLEGIKKKRDLAVLYITHDMGVVGEIADRVVVMYAGQVVESAAAPDLFNRPLHPYTRGLLDSRPRLDSQPKTRLPAIGGTVPSPADYPKDSCRFAPRCSLCAPECLSSMPPLRGADHQVRCIKAEVKP